MRAFYKLPKNPDLYKDKYTLKYGSWPSNENEAIVITNSRGSLSDFIFIHWVFVIMMSFQKW